MSGRNTAAVMSEVDVAATAAKVGAKESPKFKAKMDDIWGTESESSEALSQAIDAGIEDPIAQKQAAKEAAEAAALEASMEKTSSSNEVGLLNQAEPSAPAPERQTTPDGFSPPADVMPAATEAPLEAPEESDDDAMPEDVSTDPKKANAWTKIRAEKKELKQENQDLKRQLEEARSSVEKGEVAQRIEQLEQEVAQYEERLGQYDITQTASFNEKYTAPLVARYNRIVSLLSKSSDSETASELARQLVDPNVDRDELISSYPITTQAALGAILVEMDDLQGQRDSALKNWRETKAVLSEQEARQGISTLNKSIVEDTNKAIEALRLEGNYLYMLSESDDNWNKSVKDRIAALQGTLKDGGREDMVKLVADGLTARIYREWYEKEHKRAEALAGQINSRIKAAPDLGASSGPVQDKPKPVKARPLNSVLDQVWGADEKF